MKGFKTHQFKFDGQEHTLFKRAHGEHAPFYLRIRDRGKQRWKTLGTPNKEIAEDVARGFLRARRTGELDGLRKLTRRKKVTPEITTVAYASLGQIAEAYRAAPDGPSSRTRYGNLSAFKNVIHTACGSDPDWALRSAGVLTGDTVRAYKSGVAAAPNLAGVELFRALRSAKSSLRQARCIFHPALLDYYRREKRLALPDVTEFRKVVVFPRTPKLPYQPPDDRLLAYTFQELEATRDSHRERYLICWIALTFGLRKSEIAPLKACNFVKSNGKTHVELREVEVYGELKSVTKNGQICPRVRAANGGWERIGPLIEAMPPGQYLIAGHRTRRIDHAFREVNEWFRQLGWKTQKGIHELRAYAGSKVIEVDGMYNGSQWLRHGNIATTQQYYGRYVETTISDKPLALVPSISTTCRFATQAATHNPVHQPIAADI